MADSEKTFLPDVFFISYVPNEDKTRAIATDRYSGVQRSYLFHKSEDARSWIARVVIYPKAEPNGTVEPFGDD